MLSVRATEQSTYIITITFKDENNNNVIPNSAAWTLADENGNVVNGRSGVAITPLSTAVVSVVLSGADLAVPERKGRVKRFFSVSGTYDSSLGVGLPYKDETSFYLDNLVSV